MLRARIVFFLALYCCSALWAEPARSALSPTEQATIALFRHAAPSVVHIAVEKRPTGSNKSDIGEYGSGFIWDTAGHVITNAHVIRDAIAIDVVLPAGRLVAARVTGVAPYYDIAVLQIDENDLPEALPLGQSSSLQVGQSIFAIGNPFGLDQTLTTGVVSALKRRTLVDGRHEIADAIQIDAAINPGNSGGPLLNSSGHLVGINTAIVSSSGTSSGVGFAIPVATAKRVVPQLIQTGHATLPGIGIVAAPNSAAVLEHVHGIVIAKISPGSPASKAGLKGSTSGQVGDIITMANGIPTLTLADFSEQLAKAGVGNNIQLTIVEAGRPKERVLAVIDEAAAEDEGSKKPAP